MASIILIGNKASRNELKIQAELASAGDILLLIDSSIVLTEEQMDNMSNAAKNLEQNDLSYMSSNSDTVDMSTIDTESLLNGVVNRQALPVAAIACKREAFEAILEDEQDNLSEIAFKLIAKALASGAVINSLGQINASTESEELSNASYARCLNILVNNFTIEDLFPQHAWKEHSQESAAAAYHTLTAYFIRFEDYANANECLKISDTFEESPRSLALKAMIAFNKGETLGAVANLVSSLQQYEEKKKDTDKYVKFSPQNIELINSSLVSGLDALNKRDNEKAIDHFAKAVFNFDTFYSQHGLDNLIH